MKLFIKDTLPLIFLYILTNVLLLVFYKFLGGFNNDSNLIYFVFLSCFLLFIYLAIRYYSNRNFYKRLEKPIEDMFEQTVSLGHTPLAKGLTQIMDNGYRLYRSEVQSLTIKQQEHMDFVNQWVHQMKTPLSVIQLLVQELDDDNSITYDIHKELDRLNEGLNMSLYMARLNFFEKDFKVDTINVKAITSEVINDLKRYFIRKLVFPQLDISDDIIIYSDEKWIKFLIHQIMTNAIKYSHKNDDQHSNKKIFIRATKENDSVIFEIEDQGVGIDKSDIKRVFDPFFTGNNGREFGESTGMGLYLTKEICTRLGHEINIESEPNQGTIVRISFTVPKQ